MLMGGMAGPFGPPGRSDRETLYGGRGPGQTTQTRIVRLPGGTTTFSITSNIPLRSPGDRGGDHGDDFDMYASPLPFPSHLSGTSEITYLGLSRLDTDWYSSIFGNAMGGGNVRSPNGGHPTLDSPLQNIFSLIFGPGGPNAVHGDAVYTQEALDRIITQLMEANPSSNAAPPASQAAIEKLEKKKLDRQMMGDGKAECTICIDDMHLGDEATVLPCNHWFHEECVVLWLKEHNTCPICRAPIEKHEANENGPNGGNGDASGGSGNHQRRASEGGPMPPSGGGFFGGATSSWSGRAPRSGDFGGSSRSRGPQTPEDRERRLNSIRNLAGASSYGQSTPDSTRWNTTRRDSWSPTSPPPGGISARERSPTRPRLGRANSSSWNSQRSSRSSNNSSGNGASSNPFSWIRDRLGGGGNSNTQNNSSRRRS